METEIQTPTPTVRDTIGLIQQVHTDRDWTGDPYWKHPVAVMTLLDVVLPGVPVTHEERLVALLHDTIEDTEETRESLLARGYSQEVVEDVVLLSRIEGETYMDYIRKLVASGRRSVMRVKLADLTHNTSEERYERLPSDRLAMAMSMKPRYERAKALVRSGLGIA